MLISRAGLTFALLGLKRDLNKKMTLLRQGHFYIAIVVSLSKKCTASGSMKSLTLSPEQIFFSDFILAICFYLENFFLNRKV